MDQPFEPEELTWRDAFWRLCALAFVRFRLRHEHPRPVGPEVTRRSPG